jgi:uncharacterized protein YjbI with pentapeptide repeats
MQQDARQQRIEDHRAQAERELAAQRAQDTALQAYLDQMSTLLIEKDLRSSAQDSEVRTLARARTLTVLRRLDPSRKADVMNFLMEAGLIQSDVGRGEPPIIRLGNADLSGTDLSYPHLDLFPGEGRMRSYEAKEGGLDLAGADLTGANLSSADLRGVDLTGTLLFFADLHEANLSDANLSGASLWNANLSGVDLSDANLSDAVLIDANLSDAKVSKEQLDQVDSLEGAIMPDGSKHP